MPKAFWSGVISAGLLNVPVSVCTSTERDEADLPLREVCDCHKVPFDRAHRCAVAIDGLHEAVDKLHQLDARGDAVDDETFDEVCQAAEQLVAARRAPKGKAVEGPQMVKAVETAEGYVEVPDHMLTQLRAHTDGKVINVEKITPYHAAPLECVIGQYWLKPDKKAAGSREAFALLASGLEDGRVMFARWAPRERERPVAIMRVGDEILMCPMLHEAERRNPDDEITGWTEVEVPEHRRAMFTDLLDTMMVDEIDLSEYQDRTVDAKIKALHQLVGGETLEPIERPEPVKPVSIDDLLAQSLELAQAA